MSGLTASNCLPRVLHGERPGQDAFNLNRRAGQFRPNEWLDSGATFSRQQRAQMNHVDRYCLRQKISDLFMKALALVGNAFDLCGEQVVLVVCDDYSPQAGVQTRDDRGTARASERRV